MARKPIIGVSIGDINGIGPEVVLKSLSDGRITKIFTPVIYASGMLISYLRKQMDLQNFNFHQCQSTDDINADKVNVVNCWTEKVDVDPGKLTESGGKYAIKSLEKATDDLVKGAIHGLMTAPFSKENVQKAGFNFPGHTEYITERTGSKDGLMMMVDGETRIAVTTGHIPLKDIVGQLSQTLLASKLKLMISSLKTEFGIQKPKVAVLGLNPHAGENGALGSEEKEIIIPTLEKFKSDGHLIFGPFPADGFFGNPGYQSYDGILAMYHDQGLIPFKLMCSSHGVNFTAGLHKIRTSPAHGTAFELAGKNIADPTSTRNAFFLAAELAKSKLSEDKFESSKG